MRCPVCFEKVEHDKIFDVYDCPRGCGNRENEVTKRFGFDREEVFTEAEYRRL